MAITTIPGATSSDATTLVGSNLADSFKPTEASLISIQGLEGKDTISVSTAAEQYQVEGDAGADSIVFDALKTSTISGGDGNDIIELKKAVTSVNISGGSGVDDVDFTGGKAVTGVTVNLGGGNDTFNTVTNSTTTDSYFGGGQDNDTLTFVGDLNNTTVRGGKQDDTIIAAKITGSKLRGDNNEDSIQVTGVAKSSYVLGDAGADTINVDGLAATSTIRGGKGDDVIAYDGVHSSSTTGAVIKGDNGADSIVVGANGASDDKHTIYGGLGKDTIVSEPTSATKGVLVYGGANEGDAADGADDITTYAAADTIYGAAGKDVIDAGAGNNLVKGGADNDLIDTTSGNDTIFGGAGADTITSGGGVDSISGDAGDDVIRFAFANLTEVDTVNGGEGTDSLLISDAQSKTILDNYFTNVSGIETLTVGSSGNGATSVGLGAKAQAEGITKVVLDGAANTSAITIDASAYTSSVGITIDGRDVNAADIQKGGAGADTISTGKTGAVDMTGGAGIDTFIIESATASVLLRDLGNGGAETLTITANSALQATLTTAAAGYTASAGTTNNGVVPTKITSGATGADINMSAMTSGSTGFELVGLGGAETLTGSFRADTIRGAAGVDTLIGGDGADLLNSGAGADALTGSAGVDTFQYDHAGADYVTANKDTIADFNTSDDILGFIDDTNLSLVGTTTKGFHGGTQTELKAATIANTTNIVVIESTVTQDAASIKTVIADIESGGNVTFGDGMIIVTGATSGTANFWFNTDHNGAASTFTQLGATNVAFADLNKLTTDNFTVA